MTHTITIAEEHRQLILLALAQLSLERPGWRELMLDIASKLPGGAAMYEGFRKANNDVLPVSNIAETCAKIVETWDSPRLTSAASEMVKNIAHEIRQYAADLGRVENVGAARAGLPEQESSQ